MNGNLKYEISFDYFKKCLVATDELKIIADFSAKTGKWTERDEYKMLGNAEQRIRKSLIVSLPIWIVGDIMLQDKTLKRERIEEALGKLFIFPLTIVSATMGYGKTTAVRSFLNAQKARMIWVSVLGSDGDENVLWNKLSAEIVRIEPRIGKKLNRLGFPLDAMQLDMVIGLLREIESKEPNVLVIDDYHIIEQNDRVRNLVELIALEEIPNLHIVLISRTRPKFNHINLTSKGLCNYLDTNMLSFTLQETTDYFELMKVTASVEEIQRIQNFTKGWISAIYLLLLGAKQGFPLTEVSNINQLVADNFYHALSPDTKQILLYLSIFENFTLDQAVEILDNPNASPVIEFLQGQNAFVSYDPYTGVYTMHHVLTNFLQLKLRSEKTDLSPIYHRAGKWYLEHEDIYSAFDFYDRAGRIEELLEQINKIEKIDIDNIGIEMLQKIHAGLPGKLVLLLPYPLLQFSLRFIVSGQEELIAEGRAILGTIYEHYSKTTDTPRNLCNKILGEIEILNIFLSFNDTVQMVEHAKKAEALMAGSVSRVVFSYNEFTFGLPHFLYTYYRKAGELKQVTVVVK